MTTFTFARVSALIAAVCSALVLSTVSPAAGVPASPDYGTSPLTYSATATIAAVSGDTNHNGKIDDDEEDTGMSEWYGVLDCGTFMPAEGHPKQCEHFESWGDDDGVFITSYYYQHFCKNGDSNLSASTVGQGSYYDETTASPVYADRCANRTINPAGTTISDHRDLIHFKGKVYGTASAASTTIYLTHGQGSVSGDLDALCTITSKYNTSNVTCDPVVADLPTSGSTVYDSTTHTYTFTPPAVFSTPVYLRWYARNSFNQTMRKHYDDDGKYQTITLTQYSSTYSPYAYVNFVPSVPKVSCSISSGNSGSSPSAVTLAGAYGTGSGDVGSWSWNFGDGTTGTGQTPAHTYTNNTSNTVTYTATLTASNGTGYGTCSTLVTVLPGPPIAAYSQTSATNSQRATTTIGFADTSSGGTASSWTWSFGDGTTATTKDASHTYSTPGVFTVTHTATNSWGTSSFSSQVKVWQPLVAASFSASAGNNLHAPSPVTFTASTSCDACTYLWSFGDGTSATSASATHTYTAQGDYTATLTVTNESGTSTYSALEHVLAPYKALLTLSCDKTVVLDPPPATVTCTAVADDFPSNPSMLWHVQKYNTTTKVWESYSSLPDAYFVSSDVAGTDKYSTQLGIKFSDRGTYQISVTATSGSTVRTADLGTSGLSLRGLLPG